MRVVPNFPEPRTDLYADPGYFGRLQRAFEAAFAAWNEVPDVPKRRPIWPPEAVINHRDRATTHAAECNEVPDNPEPTINRRDKATKHSGWVEWTDVPADLTTRLCIKPEIIINHRDEAVRRASCASAKPTSASQLVLWTDASVRKDSVAGCAVASWEGLNWVRITARRPTVTKKRKPHVNITELQAIGLGLDYAVQSVERKTEDEAPLQILEVYTDSQGALMLLRDAKGDLLNPKMSKLLRKSIASGKVVRDVSLKIKRLEEAGVHTEFHWVPRSATLGNMLADKGAGLARLAGEEGRYEVENALVEIMPRPRDEYQWKSGHLPLAHSQEFVDRSRMAEHIASMLESREKSAEDETMEDTPEKAQEEILEETLGESLKESPEEGPETPDTTPEDILEKAPENTSEMTPADTREEIREEVQEQSQDVSMEDTPGESLENSPEKRPEETSEESQEGSQDSDLNLDLLYDAPVLEVDMTEEMPIDPELWRLYGESL